VYVLPEDGHRSGPKHVVVVHNKIEHEKHLLRTVVLIKVLVDTRATGCITQQLSMLCRLSLSDFVPTDYRPKENRWRGKSVIHNHNHHNSGHYLLSCLLFKTRYFGDSVYWAQLSRFHLKAEIKSSL
jgi:hypothetical protein